MIKKEEIDEYITKSCLKDRLRRENLKSASRAYQERINLGTEESYKERLAQILLVPTEDKFWP